MSDDTEIQTKPRILTCPTCAKEVEVQVLNLTLDLVQRCGDPRDRRALFAPYFDRLTAECPSHGGTDR